MGLRYSITTAVIALAATAAPAYAQDSSPQRSAIGSITAQPADPAPAVVIDTTPAVSNAHPLNISVEEDGSADEVSADTAPANHNTTRSNRRGGSVADIDNGGDGVTEECTGDSSDQACRDNPPGEGRDSVSDEIRQRPE